MQYLRQRLDALCCSASTWRPTAELEEGQEGSWQGEEVSWLLLLESEEESFSHLALSGV